MNGPEIFKRNADKLFPNSEKRVPKTSSCKKKRRSEDNDGLVLVSDAVEQYNNSNASTSSTTKQLPTTTENVILQAELDNSKEELKNLKQKVQYQREKYSVMGLKDEVICTETGLSNKQIFMEEKIKLSDIGQTMVT